MVSVPSSNILGMCRRLTHYSNNRPPMQRQHRDTEQERSNRELDEADSPDIERLSGEVQPHCLREVIIWYIVPVSSGAVLDLLDDDALARDALQHVRTHHPYTMNSAYTYKHHRNCHKQVLYDNVSDASEPQCEKVLTSHPIFLINLILTKSRSINVTRAAMVQVSVAASISGPKSSEACGWSITRSSQVDSNPRTRVIYSRTSSTQIHVGFFFWKRKSTIRSDQTNSPIGKRALQGSEPHGEESNFGRHHRAGVTTSIFSDKATTKTSSVMIA